MWEMDHKEGWALCTDAFKLWCWRRLLRVPWTTRRSNHSILKEINPEYSLEGLTLKMKLQNFDHLMQRANSLENTLILGKIESRRRRGWQRMRWLDGITDSMDVSLSEVWEMVMDREAWCAAIHGVAKSWTRLSDWTTTTNPVFSHPELPQGSPALYPQWLQLLAIVTPLFAYTEGNIPFLKTSCWTQTFPV